MTTTWHPLTRLEPRSWLLTNGEVVAEPPLETSTSGRKVRIQGTATSFYSRDLDTILHEAVATKASERGSALWMELVPAETVLPSGAQSNAATLTALQITRRPRNGGTTRAWWQFKHPTLPIHAFVLAQLTSSVPYNDDPAYYLEVFLRLPDTTPVGPAGKHEYKDMHDGSLKPLVLARSPLASLPGRHPDRIQRLREWIRDDPPRWASEIPLQTRRSMPNERTSVKCLAQLVRTMEGMASIQVPDLRDPDEPAWLELEAYGTNVTGAFMAELDDYLDGGPVLDEVLEHYNAMCDLLQRLGLRLPARTENDFQKALMGDTSELELPLCKPSAPEGEGGVDTDHTLQVELLTGTFIVNCTNASKDEVATKWEEALVLAQLSGKESDLLAYARNYSASANKTRAAKTLAERKALLAEGK